MEGVGEGDEDGVERGDDGGADSFAVPTRSSDYDPTADYKIVEVCELLFGGEGAKGGR